MATAAEEGGGGAAAGDRASACLAESGGSFQAMPGGLVIDNKPVKFVQPPLDSQLCEFCQAVLKDPVLSISCGHTFCRTCCEARMVDNVGQCPNDGKQFSKETIVVNVALASQIASLLVHCRYGLRNDEARGEWTVDAKGCAQTMRLGEREEHESVCDFARMPCPNDRQTCGLFARKFLHAHVADCPRTPCPNADKGCKYRGDPDTVTRHHRVCSKSLELGSADKVRDALGQLLESHQDLQTQHSALKRSFDEHARQHEEERLGWLKERQMILSQLNESHQELQRLAERCSELEPRLESVIKAMPSGYQLRSRDSISSATVLVENGAASSYGTSPSLLHRSVMEENGVVLERRTSAGSRGRSSSNAIAAAGTGVSHRPLSAYWERQMPFKFKCIGTFKGHSHTVWKLTSHGSTFYSADGKGTIKVWDMNNLLHGCINTIPAAHTEAILAMATNGELLFTAGSDLSIFSWECSTLKKVNSAKDAHGDDIDCLQIIGDFLFSTSHSKIKVWDIHTLQHRHTMQGLHHRVRALAYDHKRERLYSGSHNMIHVWDAVEPFSLVARIDTKFGSIYSIAICKDYLATGTYNRNVHLYDLDTREYKHALSGHLGAIAALATSPTGSFLVTGSHDSTLQIWDLDKALPYQILQRHESCVNTVLVRNDLLFSGSDDKQIKVFKLFRQQDHSAS